jgi:hypothetical protein
MVSCSFNNSTNYKHFDADAKRHDDVVASLLRAQQEDDDEHVQTHQWTTGNNESPCG